MNTLEEGKMLRKFKQLGISGISEYKHEVLKQTTKILVTNFISEHIATGTAIGISDINKSRLVIVDFENIQQRNLVYLNKKKRKVAKSLLQKK